MPTVFDQLPTSAAVHTLGRLCASWPAVHAVGCCWLPHLVGGLVRRRLAADVRACGREAQGSRGLSSRAIGSRRATAAHGGSKIYVRGLLAAQCPRTATQGAVLPPTLKPNGRKRTLGVSLRHGRRVLAHLQRKTQRGGSWRVFARPGRSEMHSTAQQQRRQRPQPASLVHRAAAAAEPHPRTQPAQLSSQPPVLTVQQSKRVSRVATPNRPTLAQPMAHTAAQAGGSWVGG